VYRVISKYRNGGTRPVIEHGPWHDDRETAAYWADVLRELGYVTEVENQYGHGLPPPKDDNNDLAAALASMA
jgi:hypothetical protein